MERFQEYRRKAQKKCMLCMDGMRMNSMKLLFFSDLSWKTHFIFAFSIVLEREKKTNILFESDHRFY